MAKHQVEMWCVVILKFIHYDRMIGSADILCGNGVYLKPVNCLFINSMCVRYARDHARLHDILDPAPFEIADLTYTETHTGARTLTRALSVSNNLMHARRGKIEEREREKEQKRIAHIICVRMKQIIRTFIKRQRRVIPIIYICIYL